ncbi:MAG: TonB family protein [Gemmatimonadales bacterium]
MLLYSMVYAIAVGTPIACAAWVLAAVLRRYGRPERAVWLGALLLALALPLVVLAGYSTADGTASSESLGDAVVGLPDIISVSESAAPVSLDAYAIALWALLSGVLLARWALGAHRLRAASRAWRPASIDGIAVSLADDVGPAVAGVFRPRIVAPDWLTTLPAAKRTLVLMHEEEHVRARDPLVMLVARAARVAVPWHPLVWFFSLRLTRAVELDCDRRVLAKRADVRAYGTTLLDISARRPSRLVAAAAFAESEAPLRSRILAMTTPPRAVSLAAIAASAVLGVVLLVGALQIPVPAVRIQVQIGESPSARPVQAAVAPAFRPSSTRPRLLNEREVQQVGEAEIERLVSEGGLFVQSRPGSPTNIVMPKFTPASIHPTLLDRQQFGSALAEAYPQELRDAGIGGTTVLLLRVAPDGSVTNVRVQESSGHESLDQAALDVTSVARFQSARNRDQPVPVWVRLPVTFAAKP